MLFSNHLSTIFPNCLRIGDVCVCCSSKHIVFENRALGSLSFFQSQLILSLIQSERCVFSFTLGFTTLNVIIISAIMDRFIHLINRWLLFSFACAHLSFDYYYYCQLIVFDSAIWLKFYNERLLNEKTRHQTPIVYVFWSIQFKFSMRHQIVFHPKFNIQFI